MRKIIDLQMKITGDPIAEAVFDPKSRDEIPKLLFGLQYIYLNKETRDQVLRILAELIPSNIDTSNGRPGMILWKILVLGTLRLNCNWDYDKVLEISNNHRMVRMMLGHEDGDFVNLYNLQTIKDNVSLFKPEILDKINTVVVHAGHALLGESQQDPINGKCDSVVVETDVHYPTDINLLYDAIRKVIEMLATMCCGLGLTDWRQFKHNLKNVRQLFHKARNLKRLNSSNDDKKAERKKAVQQAHQAYIELVEFFLTKAESTLITINRIDIESINFAKSMVVEKFIEDARRQIDQIRRRVINDETIPHAEKVFSLFERHTEWISKGKAGINQELGLRVAIIADQHGFILHHQVMEKQTDDKIAVSIIEQTQALFPNFNGCSFDKGFYTPANREELKKRLENLILPQKGKPSKEQAELQGTAQWKEARRKHSAVEAAISALENHGFDRCLDHGINGFKRYIALAVLGRNLQILGHIVQQNALKQEKRKAAA